MAVVVVNVDAPYCQLEISNATSLLTLVKQAKKHSMIDLGAYELTTTEGKPVGDAVFTQLLQAATEVTIQAKIKRLPGQCARCRKQVKDVQDYQRHWRRECGGTEARVLLQPPETAIAAVLTAL